MTTPKATFGSGKGPRVILEGWSKVGLMQAVTHHFSNIKTLVPTPYKWDLVWRLFELKQISSMSDLSLFLDETSNYYSTFRALWEGKDFFPLTSYIPAITKWLSQQTQTSEEWFITRSLGLGEPPTEFDRVNILFFITALAGQNQLLRPYTLVLTDLEPDFESKKDFFDLCLIAERWSRMDEGNPITIELDLPNGFLPGSGRLGDLLRTRGL